MNNELNTHNGTEKTTYPRYFLLLALLAGGILGAIICSFKLNDLEQQVKQLSTDLAVAQADLNVYIQLDESLQTITDGINFTDGMDHEEMFLFNKNYLSYLIFEQMYSDKSDLIVRQEVLNSLNQALEAETDATMKSHIQSQIVVLEEEIKGLEASIAEQEEWKTNTLDQLEQLGKEYLE